MVRRPDGVEVGYAGAVASRTTSSSGNWPCQRRIGSPFAATRMAVGWLCTPNAFQVSNDSSQSNENVMSWRVRNALASPKESWVPIPITVSWSLCCRANCSTPEASRLHTGQWGAQNQNNTGLAAGRSPPNATFCPVAVSSTSTDGSVTLSGTVALPSAVFDGRWDPPAPFVVPVEPLPHAASTTAMATPAMPELTENR